MTTFTLTVNYKKKLIAFFAVLVFLMIKTELGFGQITQVTGSPQTNTTSGTTLIINKPSGLAINDVMIANIMQSGSSNSNLNNTTASGWTQIAGSNLNTGGTSRYQATLLYKVATASDVTATNFSFSLSSNSDDGEGGIVAFTGVAFAGGVGGTPFDVTPAAAYNINNSNAFNATTITTATANAAVLMFGVIDNNVNISTWSTTSPGTLTELYDVPYNAGLDIGVGAAWAIKSTAGITGAGSGTLGSTVSNGSILIALRPCTIPTVTGTTTICSGATTQLTGSGTAAASNPWISSNTSVATISNIGLVTGVSGGTTNITYTNSSGCSKTITVTTSAVPSAPTGSASQSFCTSANPTIASLSATGTNIKWYAASSGGTALATSTTLVNGTHYYASQTNASGCESASRLDVTVILNNASTIALASATGSDNQSTCANSAITQIKYNIGGSGTGATVTGLPSGVSGSYSGGVYTISGTPTATGTFNYTVTTSGPCTNVSSSGTITVYSGATITLTSILGTNIQKGCQYADITTITYSIGGSGTGASVTGLPPGVTGTYNSGTYTISGAPTVTGTFNYTVTTTGGCSQATATGTLTINALPTGTITATETSGTANDNIICAGDAVIFTATAGYGAYTFYINGVRAQGPSAVNVYSSASLANGDKVTVDVANNLNCGTTFGPVIITVNPLPIPILSATNTTICAGDSVTFSTTTPGINYNFRINDTVLQSGVSKSFTTTALHNGDSVTVEVTNSNSCTGLSGATYITVNALPSGTLVATSLTSVCAGTPISFKATGGTQYQFRVNGNIAQSFSSTDTYSSNLFADGDVITVDFKNAAGCMATYSPGIIVTINPLPTGTLAVTENSGTANDDSICSGRPVTFTFSNSGYSNYDFKINGVSKQSSGLNIFATAALTNGDIVTLVVMSGNGCSDTFTAPPVTVLAIPSGSLTASANVICVGDNVTFTADTGFVNYRFKVDGVTVQNGRNNTYATTSLSTGSVVTVTVRNSNSCATVFNAITMTVNALPTGALSVSPSRTICKGATATFTATGGFSNYEFTVNGVSVQTGASAVYATNGLADGDEISVVGTNSGGCTAILDTITMKVIALPGVRPIKGTVNICEGSTSQLSDAAAGGVWKSSDTTIAIIDTTGLVTGISTGTAVISYTITNAKGCDSTVKAFVTVNALPTAITGNFNVCVGSTTQLSNTTAGGTWSSIDETTATVDSMGLVSGLVNGVVVISYSVTNSNNCSVVLTANVAVFAVQTVPPITGTFTVCQDANITLSNSLAGGVWSSSDTAIATVNAVTGVVTGVAPGAAIIVYTYTNASGCSSSASQGITINALPVPTLTGRNPICLGDTNIYKTESGQFNYIWTVLNGTITAGGSTTDDSVVVAWLNPGPKAISVNYTNANGCAAAVSATVANTPGPSPLIAGSVAVCQGSSGNTYTAPAGKIDYSWMVSAGGIITSGGTVNDSSITITWAIAGTQTVTINYADSSGCSASTPTTLKVKVNPLPVIVITNPAAACSPATVDLTTAAVTAGSTSGLSYTYYTDAATTSVYSTPATAGGGTYYIKGTTASGCSDIKAVTVTVNPQPTVVITNPAAVCAPATVDLTAAAITAGSTTGLAYTYYTDPAGLNVYSTPATAGTGTYYIKGMTASGCYDIKAVTVTINPSPAIVIHNPAAVCSPATVNLTTAAVTAGSTAGLTFTYYTDAAATNVYSTPATAGAGTYYIKGTTASGCYDIKAVTVTVSLLPTVVINNPGAVCSPATVNLTAAAVTAGSTPSLTYTYYTNVAATNVYATPATAGAGTYYIKGTNATGCYDIKAVTVTVNSSPTVVINNPVAVCSPGTVNLTAAAVTAGSTPGLTYTYYTNATATNVYATPATAGAGTYYIKGTNATGCYDIKPVTVIVNPLPTATIGGTAAVCQNSASLPVITFAGANGTPPYIFTYKINGGANQTVISVGNTATVNAPTGTTGTFTYALVSVQDNSSSACSRAISGQTAIITVNALPSTPIITPASATICQNSIQSLTAGTQPTTGSVTLSNTTDYTITNNNTTGAASTIILSGVPAGAVVNSVNVTFNIAEDDDQSLRINLKAPNGNILNLVNQKGSTGNDFTNTVVSSSGGSTFTTSAFAPPFTGTYSADAGSSINAGTGSTSNVTSFANLFSTPNGDWVFGVRDVSSTGTSGTILDWTITVNYTTTSVPTAVTWSPVTDLYTDAAATSAYTGTSVATVYAKPATSGIKTYMATATNGFGCTASQNVTVTVNPVPSVLITADYCAVGGKVQLTASSTPAASSYVWSTGETTQSILVDEAGYFSVTAYTAAGCSGSFSIGVANELVTNGNFEAGDVGVFTGYTSHTGSFYNGTGTSGLWPEGYYAVDTSAYSPSNGVGYHTAFHGKDHTTGHGKFMMINGSTALRNIWNDTLAVLPNTTYYFSAWAMNLNPVSPAQLQFSVNGVQTGTIGDLSSAAKPTAESQVSTSNWIRFYGTWTSGPTVTNAFVSIVNLNTVAGGNDFGLDDISFGTLSPFIILTSAQGTDKQTVCVNTPITDITYKVGNGNAGNPTITGLPPGLTTSFAGDKLAITGIPTLAGNYVYTISTTGCNSNSASGTMTVQRQTVTLASGNASPAVCINSPVALDFILSGTATAAIVTGLPGATTTLSGNSLTVNWTPSAAGSYTYAVITSGTGCAPDTATGTITVQTQQISLNSANSIQSVCLNTPIIKIQYVIGGTATGATVTGLPPGVTGKFNSGLFIIKGTPTSAVGSPYTYTVTTLGTCGAATATGSITVISGAGFSLVSGSDPQTACQGIAMSNIVYAVSNATGATANGLPAGVTGTYSGGMFTISGVPADDPGTYYYTIIANGTCAAGSITGSIIINAQAISLNSGSPSESVCPNSGITNVSYVLGGTATGATVTGLPAGVKGSLSGNIFTISGTAADVSGNYTYTITTSGSSCNPATITGTITIKPVPVGGNLPSVSICSGGSGALTLSGKIGNITGWEYSTDYGSTWIPVAPINTAITQAYSNITTTTMYRASVSGCGSAFSSVGTISIHNVWTGITSSDWNIASNWSDNMVASLSCATVFIPAGTPYSPQLTSDVEVPNIDIAPVANIDLNGHILSVDGAFSNTGTLTGSSTSGLEVNGTAGTVYFAAGGTSRTLKTLTVNTGGSLTLGDSLDIVAGAGFGTVIANGVLNTGDYLTLKSDANGTARVGPSVAAIAGKVTLERFIPGRRAWRFMSIPLTSSTQTIREAWQEGVNNYSLGVNYNPHPGYGTHITGNNNTSLGYDYNTTINPSVKVWQNNAWSPAEPATITDLITKYEAYCLFVRGSRAVNLNLAVDAPVDNTVLRITGTLNETGVSGNSVTKNYTGNTGDFLFVGNPYASSIDLLPMFNRSSGIFNKQFWLWDPKLNGPGNYNVGGYVTYSNGIMVPTGGVGSYPAATTIIQGGQAFMIRLSTGSASIKFRESDKNVSESNIFGRQAQLPSRPAIYTNLITSVAGSPVLVDGVATGLGKKFSAAIDSNDAGKSWNFDENLALVRDDNALAIEFRPPPVHTDTLFYRLYLRQQPYTIKIFSADIPATVSSKAWIVDKYLHTKTEINLMDTTLYNFIPNSDTNSYRNRFMLVFSNAKYNAVKTKGQKVAVSLGKTEASAVIYPNPVIGKSFNLVVKGLQKDTYTINMINAAGSLVAARDMEYEGRKYTFTFKLPAGITGGNYIVQIVNNNGKMVESIPLIIGR